MTAQFGDIRSLLHKRPSQERFHELLELIEKMGEEGRAASQSYARQQLDASWPDSTRACPQDRLKELEDDLVPWAGLLRTLDYEGQHLTDKRFQKLLDNTHLRHITHLDLKASRFTWDNLLALAQKAPFDALRGFAMRKSTSTGADRDAITQLFESKMLADLKHLSFDGWAGIKPWVFEVTASAPFLGSLESLDLSGCKASAKRFEELISRPELANLRVFRMAYQNKGAKFGRMKALTHATHIDALHTIDFADFSAEELVEFSKTEHLGSVRDLRLSLYDSWSSDDLDMDDEAIVALANSPVFTQLERLALDMNLLQVSTIEALVNAPAMQSIKDLTIKSRSYSHWGMHRPDGPDYEGQVGAVATSSLLPNLRSLCLSNLEPTDEEFERLVHSEHIASLEHLHVVVNKGLSEASLEALLTSPHLGKLRELELSSAALSPELFRRFLQAEQMPRLCSFSIRDVSGEHAYPNKAAIAELVEQGDLPEGVEVSSHFRGWHVDYVGRY